MKTKLTIVISMLALTACASAPRPANFGATNDITGDGKFSIVEHNTERGYPDIIVVTDNTTLRRFLALRGSYTTVHTRLKPRGRP
jgi:hypothetical protein